MCSQCTASTKSISIHALREEGDPTDLVRSEFSVPISIHALREEGDRCRQRRSAFLVKFLSTPSARRATTWRWCAVHRQLISIHALREEGDLDQQQKRKSQSISIHALREEGDTIN